MLFQLQIASCFTSNFGVERCVSAADNPPDTAAACRANDSGKVDVAVHGRNRHHKLAWVRELQRFFMPNLDEIFIFHRSYLPGEMFNEAQRFPDALAIDILHNGVEKSGVGTGEVSGQRAFFHEFGRAVPDRQVPQRRW